MTLLSRFTLLLLMLCFATSAWGQISIDEVNAQQDRVAFKDQLKSTQVDVDYFNLARHKAERAAIRKERNYLEIGGGLKGSLSSYNESWTAVSGGDNSIALMAVLHLRHVYTKNLFSVETKLNAGFGYNRMKVETQRLNAEGEPMVDDNGKKIMVSEGVWFKNQDEFVFSVAPAFKISKSWSYGSTFQFRSQFVNGYKSRTEQKEEHLKSKFLTPGYLDLSLDLTYKSQNAKFPIGLALSPIALNATYVRSSVIRKNGFVYGLEDPDKRAKYEGGSSIRITFDRWFGKTPFLRYNTTIYSFFGWITDIAQKNKIANYSKYIAAYDEWLAGDKNIKDKPRLPIHPIVRWENYVEIKASKYISTTLDFQLYYNRAQNVDVQLRTLLSVGLSYTFKNK